MQQFFDKVSATIDSIPDILVGLIFIGIAILLAWLAKKLIVALLKKVGLDQKLSKIKKSDDAKPDEGSTASEIIGKLVFLIVFILFVPAILEKFGMETVTQPIVDLINTFINYIPNVIACVVILLIGFFIAKIVRQLIVAAIGLTKVDKLQEKISKGKSTLNIAKLIGTVAYIFIAVVVTICALNVLHIDAISSPATSMLTALINSVPHIILALVILFVGIFLGNLTESFLVSLLGSFGLDEKCNKWLASDSDKEVKPISFNKIITNLVKAVIIVLFAVEAINALKFDILTTVGAAIIAFLPSVLVAVIFLIIAYVLCRIVDSKLHIEAAPNASKIIKTAIYVVAIFIVLSQLGIAPVIVNTAFVVAIIACGVAFALAVGLGGRQFVQDKLANVKCCKKEEKAEEKEKEE